MAIGKNKRAPKGKKKLGRKVVNPFLKKEWYSLTAPGHFSNRDFGQTIVTRSSGKRKAVDDLVGRVVSVNLADLTADEGFGFRNVKLRVEAVRDRECLTNFHGMDLTRDRLCQILRKNYSLIECFADLRTVDGYLIRVFCIGITKRNDDQHAKTSYTKASQAKKLRKMMRDTIRSMCAECTLKDLVSRFMDSSIEKAIETRSRRVFPLQRVHLRKVKVLQCPKFDAARLDAMHEAAAAPAKPAKPVEAW